MKTLNKKSIGTAGCALLMAVVLLFSCKREHMTLTTTSDVNITGYFENNAARFSEFQKILEKSGTASFLGAYGTYTIFAPTNDAIKAYLQTLGKASIDDIDGAALKDLVRFHTILDTVSTAYFKDGKLQQLTMFGQYLLTGAANTGGTTRYTINRQANVIQANIRTGNGIIHVLDKVLIPASKTLAQMIESDPSYSIFTEALKATKFYDSLNISSLANNRDTTRRFQTVVAETDAVFRASGINSFAELRKKYATKNDPTNHADSLWLFVAYRISPAARYLADIVTASSHPTLAPQEIITSKLEGQKVLINDDQFNGVYEPGYEIDRMASDNTAQNGVLHSVTKTYAIKVRQPTPLYWDVADQPELRKLPSFRKLGSPAVQLGSKVSILAGMVLLNNTTATQDNQYVVDGTSNANFYANNDWLALSFGSSTARQQMIDFVTPMIIKGRYKVWICYRQNGSAPSMQAIMDPGTSAEQVLPNIMNWASYLDASGVSLSDPNADNLLEAQGYKRYNATPTANKNWVGRLLGTVTINTTDKHKIRLSRVGGAGGATYASTLDMIQFIPIDMDQQYPRIGKDGSLIKRP